MRHLKYYLMLNVAWLSFHRIAKDESIFANLISEAGRS